MGICCVEGCQSIFEGATYFQFPTSRSLRRKWCEVLHLGGKVALGAVVCSAHFARDHYEVVRGKARLKKKVVPTLLLDSVGSESALLLENKSPELPTTDKTCQTDIANLVLPEEKIVENEEPPQPDSTTDNIADSNDVPIEKTHEEGHKESGKELIEDREIETSKDVSDNNATLTRNSIEKACPPPDPKQPPDFEDMITNYQIKNSKPHVLMAEEREIEVPAACEREDVILVDDQGDVPPVFIEVSVGKDNITTTNVSNEDCLMVLESVQVEVDPSSLMLPERELEEIEVDLEKETEPDVEIVKPPDRQEDPISLLTSSDESDVIIQERHIETVEVSDATDEDDMPLVKLVKIEKTKKPKKKDERGLEKLLWRGQYDSYCVRCHFTTTDNEAYRLHVQEHEKVLQVCSVCNYTTASKNQLGRHLRKHKHEKRHMCHLCEYRSRHEMSLKYHLESHESDKKFVQNLKNGFRCRKCGFETLDEVEVLRHVRACVGVKNLHFCPQCIYNTKRFGDLKRHFRRKHANEVVEIESESSQGPD